MAHRDLGQFYLSVGDYTGALKHFTKIRESCTTSQHVVDMCIAILEVKSPLLDSPFTQYSRNGSSSSYYKETTHTSRHMSSKPTPRLMLRQTPHQQRLPLQLSQAQRQPRKRRKGPNGRQNSTLQVPLLTLGKGTMRRRRISF